MYRRWRPHGNVVDSDIIEHDYDIISRSSVPDPSVAVDERKCSSHHLLMPLRAECTRPIKSRRMYLFGGILLVIVACIRSGRFFSSIRVTENDNDHYNTTSTNYEPRHDEMRLERNKAGKAATIIAIEKRPRNIIFVHVGKTGGMTLKMASRKQCTQTSRGLEIPDQAVQVCMERFRDSVLPFEVKDFVHLWRLNEQDVRDSSSFLFMARNPVDRFISAYRYYHPEACSSKEVESLKISPAACQTKKYMNDTSTGMYKFYHTCFPTLQDFVQAFHRASDGDEEEEDDSCHRMAHETAQGKISVLPHLKYNYAYYAHHTMYKFPSKEIFVVRTEHTWDDLVNLDKHLGGNGYGGYRGYGKNVTHGSELYKGSMHVSPETYEALCCALQDESRVYQDIVMRALNLNDSTKRQTLQDLHDKCRRKEAMCPNFQYS